MFGFRLFSDYCLYVINIVKVFEQQNAKIILTRLSVIVETTRVFSVLSIHGKSQRNSTLTQNYKTLSWRVSASAANENLNIREDEHNCCHYRLCGIVFF